MVIKCTVTAMWVWSRTRACLGLADDPLVRTTPLAERYGDFARFLDQPGDYEHEWHALRMSETSGRPLGSEAWLEDLEAKTGCALKPQKRGPKLGPRIDFVYLVNWHRNSS